MVNSKPAISAKDPFNGPPKPFSFKYGVVDAKSGSNFDHAQQQDSTGVVTGKLNNILSRKNIYKNKLSGQSNLS